MEDGIKSSGLDVGTLVSLFEDSEDATLQSRQDAEQDRDYYDNKQLTAAEKAALAKRGQPEVVVNRIKRKVDFLIGMEKSQRVRPQALPRTPMHEEDAEGASMALRYVTESEDYNKKRSGVWKNMLVEGFGGIQVAVEERYNEICIDIKRVAWDRAFADPHSSEPDFSDAKYLGVVVWMDYDDALTLYPDKKEALESTLAQSNPSDTYDDKPKFRVWADAKRKRIRIVEMWVRQGDDWFFYEFTWGGILKDGPSPYQTDKGESDCALFFASAYVDRDNNRYGMVREMLGPQDEINKRRSKSLHLLNTKQIIYRKNSGAIDDIERTRKEAARPDGVIGVEGNPNNPLSHDIQLMDGSQLAAAQLGMMQQSQNDIDLMGPNATMLGDKTGSSNAASGKAIIASQQGGMMEMGDLLDHLRDLDIRVFRAIWARIRQFWTAEKWVRVTDDERNIKWVGMNVDPMRMQQIQQDPQAMEMISGSVSNVAELDCDITIDDAPDSLTPQLEQFEALVALKQYDAAGELPFRAIIRAAPNLRNKEEIFAEMDKQAEGRSQQAQMQEQLEVMNAQEEIKNTAADTQLKQAKARETMQPVAQPDTPKEHPARLMADVEDKRASATLKHNQAMKTALEARMMPYQMAQSEHRAA